MTSNSNSNVPDLRAPPTRGSSTATSSGLRGLRGAPPPPRRAAANADATAASASGSSGRTPVAHRTRHMNYQAQRPTSTISVAANNFPPSRRTMAPPPPPTRSAVDINNNSDGDDVLPPLDNSKQFNNSTTTALQRQADDGIAKRRAELRRLQQSRGAKSNAASTAAARSRLGGVGDFTSSTVSGRQTMIPPPVVSLAAQESKKTSLSSSMGGTSTPVICSSPRLPSTATITRRLDYDACVDDSNSKSNHTVDPGAIPSSTSFSSSIPPPPLQQPPPQSQPTKVVVGGMGTGMNTVEDDQDDNNSSGHWKRTSEIFNVGKQLQQQKQQQDQRASLTGTNIASSATGMSLNLFSPSGPDRTNPTPAANYRPPLGVIPMVSGFTEEKYTQVPPLVMESLTFQHEQQQQQTQQQQLQQTVPPTIHHQDQGKNESMLLPSIVRKTSPMTIVEEEKSIVVQQHDLSSGKSTPVMSDVDHHHDCGGLLPKAMKVGTVEIDVNKRNTKSVNNEAHHDNNNDDDDHDVDVSRLMVILERNEQEKKVALEKLTRMKMLLRLEQEQKATKTKFNSNSSNDINKISGASVLLDELKGVVATHGESAAGVWIAQQLENTVIDRLSSSRPSRVGGGTILRGDDNNMLLSSIIPPLTPRSRSGSRAASPERGGGLGGLIDNNDDVLGGTGGSSRAKRMTTPLPKHFNKTAVGVSSGGSGSEGDNGGDGKGAGRASSQNTLVHESVENEYLVKAAMSIPNEYGTMLASYLVRRPYVYGMPGHYNRDTSRDEMWSSYTHLISSEEYQQSATALEPTSIDIVAYIEADGSVFTLTGRCNARHGKVSSAIPGSGVFDGESNCEEDATLDWIVFDDVEGKDKALGKVTYIDAEGNEKDYWLDSIYEEALTTRESYCMSMLSTAYALKEVTGGGSFMISSARVQNHQHRQTTVLHAKESTLSPPLNDSVEISSYSQHQPESLTQPCQPVDQRDHDVTQALQQSAAVVNANQAVETESSKARHTALLEQHRNDEESKSSNAATSDIKLSLPEPTSTVTPAKDDKQAKQTEIQPEEICESDSALPFLVVSILSVLFSMLWFIVKIPFRIGSVIVSVWLRVVTLRVLWLLLADDNGAWGMGAGVDFEYNMPGIY